MNKTAYMLTFGDASFAASNFKMTSETATAKGQRGARDTTVMTIEAWANSTESDLPSDAREALFNYSFRPQTQEFQTLTAEIREPGKDLDGQPLCTYTFQRSWVTHYREHRPPGRPDVQVYVKFRALFSQDATTEVKVS
jgi:hypothetical protein